MEETAMNIAELDKWEEARTEYDKWREAEYPYDRSECGLCATQHDTCYHPKHVEMRQVAQKLGIRSMLGGEPKKFRRTVLIFREKYAEFYPGKIKIIQK
jgi:hypothetical protein